MIGYNERGKNCLNNLKGYDMEELRLRAEYNKETYKDIEKDTYSYVRWLEEKIITLQETLKPKDAFANAIQRCSTCKNKDSLVMCKRCQWNNDDRYNNYEKEQ